MDRSFKANGYEFFFESEELQPSVGRGHTTHEVKVIQIYDRLNGEKIFDDFTGRHIGMGKGEREAFENSASDAEQWAEAQR